MTLLSLLVAAFAALVPVAASTSGWELDAKSPLCSIRQSDGAGKSIELVQTPGNEETEITIRIPRETKIRRGAFDDGLVELFPMGQEKAAILVSNAQTGCSKSTLWFLTLHSLINFGSQRLSP